MKNNKRVTTDQTMLVISIILSIELIAFITIPSHIVIVEQELSREEEVLSKYTELYDKVENMNNNIELLESSYNDNVNRIYKRITEIHDYSDDETRDAVINKLEKNKDDPIKLEASVLALIENYEEFKSDIEIQTYLNDNANILESVDRYESILDGYNEFLTEYNSMYLDDVKTE